MLDIAATSLPEPKRGNFLSRREGHTARVVPLGTEMQCHIYTQSIVRYFGTPLRLGCIFADSEIAVVQVVLEFGAVRGAS